MSDFVQISVASGVQTIRMNRPEKKNALTTEMYGAMASALREAGKNPNIRACLFLGSPGAYCAGNDIGDFIKAASAAPGEVDTMAAVFDFLEQIIMAPKPVVAGVDGLAIGVGTTMLMHCDYVLASDRSSFKTPFVDLGLVPEAGSSLIAPRLIGHHRAFELLAMGKSFSAQGAMNAGFVNEITTHTDIETKANATVMDLASKPPQALKLSRDLIRGDRSDIVKCIREEAVLFGQRLKTEEAQKAFKDFMSRGAKKV